MDSMALMPPNVTGVRGLVPHHLQSLGLGMPWAVSARGMPEYGCGRIAELRQPPPPGCPRGRAMCTAGWAPDARPLHAPAPAQGHHGSCGNLPVEDDGAGTAHEAAGLADDEDDDGGSAAARASRHAQLGWRRSRAGGGPGPRATPAYFGSSKPITTSTPRARSVSVTRSSKASNSSSEDSGGGHDSTPETATRRAFRPGVPGESSIRLDSSTVKTVG